MSDKSNIKLLFESCKARYEASNKELLEMLNVMVEYGMAKEIEDGEGGDYEMIIVADPSIMSQIDYFTWDEGTPQFWNELLGLPVIGKVEWW